MAIIVLIIWKVSFHIFALSPIKLTEWNNCWQLAIGFWRFLKLVATINVINKLVLLSSCYFLLAVSIHFACTRCFFFVVLTQFCYFRIAPNCELVVNGNTWKTLPAKCDTDLLLQHIAKMCFGVFKTGLPLWRWNLSEVISRFPFAIGIPVQIKLK